MCKRGESEGSGGENWSTVEEEKTKTLEAKDALDHATLRLVNEDI